MENNNAHTQGEMMADIRGSVATIRTKNAPYIYIAEVKIYDNVIDGKTGTANAARIVETWNAYDVLKAENERLKEQNKELLEALHYANRLIIFQSLDDTDTYSIYIKPIIDKYTEK